MTEVCGADAGAWIRELDRLLYTLRSQSQGAYCDLRATPTSPTITTEDISTTDGVNEGTGKGGANGHGSEGTTKALGEADNQEGSFCQLTLINI